MGIFKSKKSKGIEYKVQTFYKPEIKDKPPQINSNSLEDISANEAINIIKQNLPLENKRIIGDLIMGRQDLENPYEIDTENGQKIQMAGLPGMKDFERWPFQNKIEVKKCVFEAKVVLSGMDFKKVVKFISTRFCSDIDFQLSIFNESLTIYGCSLEGSTIFSDSVFWDSVQFNRNTFNGPSDFYNTSFQKGASFAYSVFNAHCTFTNSYFKSTMLVFPCLAFTNAICYADCYFMDTRFDGIADFGGAQFRRKVDFTNASFKYINLKQVQFNWLELKWEQVGRKKLIFGSLTLKGINVEKEYLTEEEFNHLFQNRVDVDLSEKHRQYDILKGIFLKQGDFESTDKCYYDWKQIERKESDINLNPETWIVKIFHYLNWFSCGYGVKPIRTLLFASVLIFFFGLIYTILNSSFTLDLSLISRDNILVNSFLDNIEYSFLVFMNFTSDVSMLGPSLKLLFLIERILGWITLLLFVTTYTRIMLR